MPRNSLLALLLTLFVAWSANTGGLFAQDPLNATLSDACPAIQPGVESAWFDDSSDPRFQRLPPVDGPAILEAPQMTPRPRDARLGAGLVDSNGRAPFTARLWWIPQQDLKHQSGTLAMNGEEIEVAFPVRIDSDGIWLALGSAQRLEISTSAVLPDSGLPMPDQLWDIDVAGATHVAGDRAGLCRLGTAVYQALRCARSGEFWRGGDQDVPEGSERGRGSFLCCIQKRRPLRPHRRSRRWSDD